MALSHVMLLQFLCALIPAVSSVTPVIDAMDNSPPAENLQKDDWGPTVRKVFAQQLRFDAKESPYNIEHDPIKNTFTITTKEKISNPNFESVFRVRLVGPEVVIAQVTPVGNGENIM